MAARLQNDPDKYIRRVKGGKFQARPYDPVTGERADLGELFPTIGAAQKAIHEFWWGKRQDIPKFTKRIRKDGVDRFYAIVPFHKHTYKLGPFDTRDEAAAAAQGLCQGVAGPLFGYALSKRLGCGSGSYRRGAYAEK